MHPRKPQTMFFVPFLLIAFLTSCARPASPPVRASWSEQYAAAKKSITGLGSEFVLDEVLARPLKATQSGTPDPRPSNDPGELRVYLGFESVKPITVPDRIANNYAIQSVTYNDYHLAESLRVDDAGPRYPLPHSSLDQVSMIQTSPQDAFQLTLAEGEAYMGTPATDGNTSIHLVWDVAGDYLKFEYGLDETKALPAKDQPDLKKILAPAWLVDYGYVTRNSNGVKTSTNRLFFLVNAQTGEILRRYKDSW